MLTATTNISSPEWTQLGVSGLRKRKLTVEFDSSSVTIFINNSYKPPISWFLTDELGEMIKLGQIEDPDFSINIQALKKGVYFLRIAGEVHIIRNA